MEYYNLTSIYQALLANTETLMQIFNAC